MDEFALIRRYFARLTPHRADVALGIGDDCALLQPTPGLQLAVTSDTLIAGRHFPEATAPADIGWKALAVNLSDLAAMGAEPRWFTLALSLPSPDAAWLEGFAGGLRELAQISGIALVGGDTTRGPLSITITAMGEVPPGQALRRDGARPGDRICVTGTLGDAALALRLLERPGLPPQLRQRLDRPTPRLAAGLGLRGLATAALDLSDGLAGDLGHILAASGVGAEIDLKTLPASAHFNGLAPVELRSELQLRGGDDYELCVCLPPEAVEEARQRLDVPLTEIGRITAEPGLRSVDTSGDKQNQEACGYRHF
ncbi:thiamine-phosphate kinase [Solimonas sp. K1W22B-7]|uniref:thiamine-phosphate kinase n=1 Tax=Solimonas sp. K1W22B-7 TaxID=2303331 RepID=UPI000E337969|nr:thiamine-phosphate kinase [Solimonas sp. K1W22B-7]AXQ29055.1 thiamine-phosphate kinase [Solimonas sp. K1W22B-7]